MSPYLVERQETQLWAECLSCEVRPLPDGPSLSERLNPESESITNN